MPEGNDAQAAAQELAERYPGQASASALIEANKKRRSRELVAAIRTAKDVKASEALDLKELSERAGVEVLDASVRGKNIVFAYRRPDGRTAKGRMPVKAKSKAKAKAKAKAEAEPSASEE